MTTSAETTPPNGGDAPGPAAGEELSIPKYRLDEVSAEVRRLREELAMKDRLYTEERQRQMATANQPQEAELTPEETGLDPQIHQAVVKVAQKIAGRQIAKERVIFEQQIGMLASRTEKTQLLATKGADKAKLLPEIERRQQEHFRTTGGYIPAELVLELIQSEDKDRRIAALEAKLAGKPIPQAAQGGDGDPASLSSAANPQTGGPSPAGTRQMPSGSQGPGGPQAQKGFSEGSVEEMEARLEERFKSGQVL